MTDVIIERLHARYRGFTEAEAVGLDAALARLVDRWLAPALAGLGPADRFAVCIPDLEVAVALEPGTPVDRAAERWAGALADGLATTVSAALSPSLAVAASGPAGGADLAGGIVCYRREVDVVVDVAVSVAAGDRSRLWAWNQTGVWTPTSWPTADDVARLLAARPTMVPTVLAAFGRSVDVPLTIPGWCHVARAVTAAVGVSIGGSVTGSVTGSGRGRSPGPAGRDGSGTIDGSGHGPDRRSGSGPAVVFHPDAALMAAARRVVPEVVWRSPLAAHDTVALAAMALACRAPALVRSPVARAAVAAPDPMGGVIGGQAPAGGIDRSARGTAAGRAPQPAKAAAPELVPARPDATPSFGDTGRTGRRPEGEGTLDRRIDGLAPAPDPTADQPPSARGGDATQFGGVLFLIHPLRALGIVDRVADAVPGVDPAAVICRIATELTGVPVDDPAIATLSGLRAGEVGAAEPLADLVAAATAEIEGWLRDRTVDPTSTPGVATVWRRPAVIDRQPGWIEIELPLHSVDTVVRAAGLDLDPGFVWWLGSVVRFRYV